MRCEVEGERDGGQVTVAMGPAWFDAARIPATRAMTHTPCQVGADTLNLTAVGLGNPHCVAFFEADQDLDQLPWLRWGADLETSEWFPNRTNVQFAAARSRSDVDVRVWERGAGQTQASGSSACAVAAAGVLLNRLDRQVRVRMPGGVLFVEVTDSFELFLKGPVEKVYDADLASI